MLPLTRSRNRARFFGIPFSPSALFEGGTVAGAWYDPSDYSTLFDDAAGTTPVSAPGNGADVWVGLMLDKSAPVAQTGYYSGAFDGAGDYLTTATDAAFGLGTGDFTIEGWLRPTAYTASANVFVDFRSGTEPSVKPDLEYGNTGTLIYRVNGSTVITGGTIPLNTWTHIALARSSGTTKLFINGVQSGSSYSDSNDYGASARVRIGADDDGSPNAFVIGFISNVRVVKGTAVYTTAFTPPTAPLTAISGTSLLTCQNNYFKDNSGNAFAVTPSGNPAPNLFNPFNATAARSVNNAFQTQSAKRPKLAARYNLLTYSEEFDNGAWTKGAASVTANTSVAPNGTTTADTFTSSATNQQHYLYGGDLSINVPNVNYTASISVKAGTYNFVTISYSSGAIAAWAAVTVNLSTGVITKTGNGAAGTLVSSSIAPQGNGWYRVTVTASYASGGPGAYLWVSSASSGTPTYGNYGMETWLAAGTETILVWGADLRPASQATGLIGPTYQRVAAATVYDTAGFLPYLAFDGLDDSMSTNSIDFSAGDKMTVWAGVRKLSDAATAALAELSVASDTKNGAFGMFAPANSGANSFAFRSRGTVQASADPGVVAAAPVTRVQTGIADISAPVVTLRLNGTQAATNTATQGTGNYGNYPLYIGMRNNASLPFTGWLTSLIVRGAQSTQSQIEATEAWVNGKTGAY